MSVFLNRQTGPIHQNAYTTRNALEKNKGHLGRHKITMEKLSDVKVTHIRLELTKTHRDSNPSPIQERSLKQKSGSELLDITQDSILGMLTALAITTLNNSGISIPMILSTIGSAAAGLGITAAHAANMERIQVQGRIFLIVVLTACTRFHEGPIPSAVVLGAGTIATAAAIPILLKGKDAIDKTCTIIGTSVISTMATSIMTKPEAIFAGAITGIALGTFQRFASRIGLNNFT